MGRCARDFSSSDEMNVLRIDHLSKSFGRLSVTDDVSLTIAEGERHVIIGPNGAGKTSLINQISGQIQPESGRILLRDHDITRLSPDRISRMGVARTFQRNNLFQNLSVMDNMRLALQVRHGNPLNFFSPAAASIILTERAANLLKKVHLTLDDSRLARQLSYGEQRHHSDYRAYFRPAPCAINSHDRARHAGRIFYRRPYHRPLLRQGSGHGHTAGNSK
jgi:ABC-type branched-subunit amino acid transport system ATPase component